MSSLIALSLIVQGKKNHLDSVKSVVLFFLIFAFVALFLNQALFFIRAFDVMVYKDNSFQFSSVRRSGSRDFIVELSKVQSFHIVNIFWAKIFLGKDVSLGLINYRNPRNGLVYSRSLGLRFTNDLNKIAKKIEHRISVKYSKNIFF